MLIISSELCFSKTKCIYGSKFIKEKHFISNIISNYLNILRQMFGETVQRRLTNISLRSTQGIPRRSSELRIFYDYLHSIFGYFIFYIVYIYFLLLHLECERVRLGPWTTEEENYYRFFVATYDAFGFRAIVIF